MMCNLEQILQLNDWVIVMRFLFFFSDKSRHERSDELLIPHVCLGYERFSHTRTHTHHKGYSHTVLERSCKVEQHCCCCHIEQNKHHTEEKGRTQTHNKSNGTYSNKLSKPLGRLEVQSKV